MKIVRGVSFIGMMAMIVALLYGFIGGSFFDDGATLMTNPWGVVSLVDLYVGFALFSLWIIYREESLPVGIGWTVLMMVFGFLTASAYLFYHSFRSEDVTALLLGKNQRV